MAGLIIGLIYLILGVLLAELCGTRIKKYLVFMVLLMLLTIVLPLIVDPSPRNLIQSVILLFVIGIEVLFPYRKLIFTSDENLQNVAFISLKRCASILVSVYAISIIAKWPAPVWSLNVNGTPLWLQAIVAFVVLDLFLYIYHRGQHHFDFWWKLHKIHHVPTQMTTLVAGRIHIVEWAFKQILGPGLLTYFFGFSPDAFIFGYVIPVLLIDSFAHANLDFPTKKLRWLNFIFGLPNTHALHHTPDRDRVNFGVMLMVWDIIFGTFQLPDYHRPTEFGIANDHTNKLGIFKQHLAPFKAMKGP